jgi:hypothetical protein
MKIRVLFRQIQQVPAEKRAQQAELEHRSDLACVRLGIPLPTRMRPFTGNMDSRIRIHEREYDSIAEFTRLHMVWVNDAECQQIAQEWETCYDWQRQEILYVDDNRDPIIPWIQMAAEQGKTIRYTVNPNYTMPPRDERK